VQQFGRLREIMRDDEAPCERAVDRVFADSCEVVDCWFGPGSRSHPLPELVECHGRSPGAFTGALEVNRPVPGSCVEPGVHQPARGVEDRCPHRNGLAQQIELQGLDETAHGCFGCRVHRCGGHRRESPVTRRGHDHLGWLTYLQHPWHELAHSDTHTEDVHPEAPAPVIRLLLPGQTTTTRGDPGVEEQQIAAAVFGECAFCEIRLRQLIGDVGLHPLDAAQLRAFGDGRLERLLFYVSDDDLGATAQ
jgi:hypothetical protein